MGEPQNLLLGDRRDFRRGCTMWRASGIRPAPGDDMGRLILASLTLQHENKEVIKKKLNADERPGGGPAD